MQEVNDSIHKPYLENGNVYTSYPSNKGKNGGQSSIEPLGTHIYALDMRLCGRKINAFP